MKTAISLPDATFEEAEQLAKRLGMSRSELYTTALEKFLETQRRDSIKEALNNFYSEEDSSLDPALIQMQMLSL